MARNSSAKQQRQLLRLNCARRWRRRLHWCVQYPSWSWP
jgi:hypothetical protein